MGLISSSQTIVRYRVDPGPDISQGVMEYIRSGLISNAFPEEKDEHEEIVVGWVPFESPYDPDFEKYSMIFGAEFIFSLRIDKKTVPAKALAEQLSIAFKERLAETGREFLSKSEKSEIREILLEKLLLRVPFVPSMFDVAWNYEERKLSFFSNSRAAIELFETMFLKTFQRKITQVFPYTLIQMDNPNLLSVLPMAGPLRIGGAA